VAQKQQKFGEIWLAKSWVLKDRARGEMQAGVGFGQMDFAAVFEKSTRRGEWHLRVRPLVLRTRTLLDGAELGWSVEWRVSVRATQRQGGRGRALLGESATADSEQPAVAHAWGHWSLRCHWHPRPVRLGTNVVFAIAAVIWNEDAPRRVAPSVKPLGYFLALLWSLLGAGLSFFGGGGRWRFGDAFCLGGFQF
jgi:hypothetical protein